MKSRYSMSLINLFFKNYNLDPNNYALVDVQSEKRYKFTLQSSLSKAKSTPLLQGWKFLLMHKDENQEMSCNDIKSNNEKPKIFVLNKMSVWSILGLYTPKIICLWKTIPFHSTGDVPWVGVGVPKK